MEGHVGFDVPRQRPNGRALDDFGWNMFGIHPLTVATLALDTVVHKWTPPTRQAGDDNDAHQSQPHVFSGPGPVIVVIMVMIVVAASIN